MSATGSDSSSTVHGTGGQQPDRRLLFLRELVDDNARIAGDITEITDNTWAIHGAIPVDGDVIMAEYDTYDQARIALDSLSADGQSVTPP
jgi:hypothetical protein